VGLPSFDKSIFKIRKPAKYPQMRPPQSEEQPTGGMWRRPAFPQRRFREVWSQVADQDPCIAYVAEAFPGIFLRHRCSRSFNFDVPQPAAHPVRFALQNRSDGFCDRLALKRLLSRQTLVRHAAETPDVHTLSIGFPLPAQANMYAAVPQLSKDS